jgi:galactose mutarotase-like enzyme
MDERHIIGSDRLSATITAQGAELVSLKDGAGRELMWHGGPDWPRHSPVLFPIVGRLTDDTLLHQGKAYRLTQHGLARDQRFTWLERGPKRAVLQLEDSAATLALYPFRFRLQMIYEIDGATLSVTARVGNPGEHVLPCGMGAHPAFIWPLAEGVAKDAHRVEFGATERGETLSVQGGLIGPTLPLPGDGRILPLSEALFREDALVLQDVVSSSLRFSAQNDAGDTIRALTIAWRGYKDLGIWSKPTGADFLCIEPWFSMASPIGWQGEFADKPGLMHLAPGESRDFVWSVTPEG